MALVLDGTTGTITNLVVETSQLPIGIATASGTLAYFGMSTAPTGWLKANGAAIFRSTYSDLFTAIGTTYGAGDGSTTFNIPDLRGEFLRSLDDGRGIDTARALGSAQADIMKAHVHPNSPIGGGAYSGNQSKLSSTWGPQNVANVNTGAFGGAETRPRNVALLACIKY
tara:strand:+ start:464 stop:970 length:507 start_codon:yes stop_codon:yes gene_type:complete